MALTATLIITTIPTQQFGVPFTVSGTYQLNQSTWTDQLIYEDNGGAAQPIASPTVSLGISSWSYTHPGNLPVGNHTIQVKDPATGLVVTSNTFAVVAGKAITIGAITAPVAGAPFSFTGTLSGYSAAPGLTYQLTGPIVGSSTPVVTAPVGGVITASSWASQLTIATAGNYRIVVTDGSVASTGVSFTVSPASVNHVITPIVPASVTAGATYAFTGTLSGYATPPTLTYTVNNSVAQTVTGVTNTGWSMSLVAPALSGAFQVAVTDGTTSGSTTLNVTTAAKVITPLAPSGTVAGQSFTFTGVLSGYTTIPALSYTISPGGSPVTMTGISITGWAMTVTITTAGNYSVSVTDGTITSQGVAFTVGPGSSPGVLRTWYQNPGMDGSFWVQPFQNSANWITSGSLITALRGGSPSVNVSPNYAPPWYIGQASDPLVTVTDGTHSIVVHMPLGATIETPASQFDQSVGGADATQPYLVWSISGATMTNAAGQAIGAVQATGSKITGTYGFAVQDGAGLIMVDAVTGAPGDNNSIGNVQDYELSKLAADPNYVIQHMLAFQLDIGQASAAGPIWPLKVIDGGATYTGPIPQGTTVGIPANVARPTGQTRGFYAWWDCFQQFGGFNYNFGATGGINVVINSFSGAYSTLVNQMVAAWPAVAQQLCILNYNNGVSGAQYSLATTKGAIPGSTNAYPAPPPIDLSPTGGKNVAPSSFGAWYPSGYNVTPTNSTTGSTFIISPNTPANIVAGTPFTFTGVLAGYTTAPTLTYSVNGAAAVSLTGVTATGWSALITVIAPGATTIVVTDAQNAASGSTAFSVSSTTPTSTPVTWSASDLAGGITLSNGNYTATATGSNAAYSTPQGVRATAALSPSQILAWEVTFSAITQNTSAGVTDQAHALNTTGGMGADTDSIGAYPSTGTGSQPPQTVYYNNNQLTAGNSVATVAPGTVSFVVNGTNLYFSDAAMRSTSGVSWNNSTTADPVQNIGGLSFAGVNGAYFPTFETGEGGAVATLNDGTSAFSSFLASYIAAHPTVVSISGQTATTPSKSITPSLPSGVIVGAAFTFTGSLSGYTSPPTLTYSLNGAAAVALTGVTSTGWSSTIVTQVNGSNTITVTDGTVSSQVSFTASTQGGGTVNRVTAPLTGTVTTGTWNLNLRQTLANSPSGLGSMQYNVLPPAQYNANLVYPVLFVFHPDFDGMNGSSYPRDGASFVTGAAYGGSYSLDSMYNSVAFRTAHPCFVVACQCDQTLGDSNANGNFGGYNDSQNSGWNENAVNAVFATVAAQYPIDQGKRYTIGYSLGGIGTLAYLVDNNQYNGPGLKIWTAGATFSDQLFRPATPNSNVFARMSSVPLACFSTDSDNVPSSYDQPAWQTYTGNSNYPTKSNYDSGGMAAIRAGSTNYYYVNYGSSNPATTFMPMNALGGDGDQMYAWLFSQVSGGSSAPTITGVSFTPAATVIANSAVNTVAGTLLAGSANGALTGITYSVSPTTNFKVSGSSLQFATATVASGTYPLTVTVAATNASNSPQSYTINVLVAPQQQSAAFSVANGQITYNGAVFHPAGINMWDFEFVPMFASAGANQLTGLFPGITVIRVACNSYTTASTFATPTANATALGIIVVFCNCQNFNADGTSAGNSGGGQGVIFTNANGLLPTESAWYASLATAFKSNPWVWFDTNNEPPGPTTNPPATLAQLSTWQQATYNAIRNTGNTNIIVLELWGGGVPSSFGTNGGMTVSVFNAMTNVVYGMHQYGWQYGAQTGVVSVANIQQQMTGYFATLQQIQSQQGVIPIFAGECGDSTTGNPIDTSGQNLVNAVIAEVGVAGGLAGAAFWEWNSAPAPGDRLVTSGALTSPYGTSVAAFIKSFATAGAGTFKVSGGKVLAPNGTTFKGAGVSFWDNQFTSGVTNAACQPMLTLFPGTNIVRLARVDSTFWTPQTYAQQINWLTAKGIVVVIENHRTSNGQTGGGGQGAIYTGTLLAQEQAWYSALATYFKNNTYVWFGTNNEPPADGQLLALWQWQQTTYNTIRTTGSTAIVEIEQGNPYLQGSNSGLSNTIFSKMTNIVFGPHYYSWIWGGNGSTVVPQSTIYNAAIGATNAQYGGIVQQIQTLQGLTSADGVVPVGCFEYGPSTTGSGVDASGLNCVSAVLQAVQNGNLFCCMAWLWGNIGDDNLQDANGNVQTPYGTTVAAGIKAITGGGSTGGGGGGGGGTESAAGTTVTGTNGSINASPTPGAAGSGNVLTIGADATIYLNGIQLGGANVTTLYYDNNHTAWQLNTAGNWYTPITSTTTGTQSATPPPGFSGGGGGGGGTSTYFRVNNGQILTPTGAVFKPKGVAMDVVDLQFAVTNAQAQPLTTLFPGVNIVRLYVAVYPNGNQTNSYAAGSLANIQSYVKILTNNGIVVAINDGTDSTTADNGGGAGVNYTTANGMLTPMANYYQSLATGFLNNPYVWFCTRNEPCNNSQGALTVEHVATYNAIRGTGNGTIIGFEQVGGGTPGGYGFSPVTLGSNNTAGLWPDSAYSTMTNIVWAPHCYAWVTNNNTSVSYCAGVVSSFVSQCQQITSADGTVPVVIWEYAIGTGATQDPGGVALTTAVQQSSVGSIAWGLDQYQAANSLTNIPTSNSLTTWGTQTATWIAS